MLPSAKEPGDVKRRLLIVLRLEVEAPVRLLLP